jgi:uncharacterized protein
MQPPLSCTEHRPWPIPSGPWVMKQIWHDLLFAHWPVPPSIMRPLVPRELDLHTYDHQCWIAVTPFHMSGIRARGLPPIPGLSRTPELNVRTYVTVGEKPGVYFFSLDAGSHAAVWAARHFYLLPYFYAQMSVSLAGEQIAYSSRRRAGAAEFRGHYQPIGPVEHRAPGTLAHWLTERYCLYTVARGKVFRGEIHHLQWPLQDAAAQIVTNTMAAAADVQLPDTAPLLHFSRYLEVLIWRVQRVH